MLNNSVIKESTFKFIFRALKYRNYRLFFIGQCISLIGTWMQVIAMSWLVYRMTNSALLLGFVAFSSQIPGLFFTPFAGVIIDRWSKRTILIVTQSLALFQALILAILVLSGITQVWHLVILGIFLGIINSFDMPARQSFVVEMVENRDDLGNAIALNSSIFNGARLVGPSLAGMLVASMGEGICFLINSISYIFVIAALLAMKIKPIKKNPKKSNILQEMLEGFSYSFGFKPIKYILLLLTLMSLMGMSYTVLMPIFAKIILHGNSKTLGFLVGSSGVGALIGAFYLASKKNVVGLPLIIVIGSSMFGFCIILFSLSKYLFLSLIIMLFAGFGMMVQMASSNTILQTILDEDKRGRVMSFYTLSFLGTMPFGNLIAGFIASKIGGPNALIIGGITCILGSMLFASKLKTINDAILLYYAKMPTNPDNQTNTNIPPSNEKQ